MEHKYTNRERNICCAENLEACFANQNEKKKTIHYINTEIKRNMTKKFERTILRDDDAVLRGGGWSDQIRSK